MNPLADFLGFDDAEPTDQPALPSAPLSERVQGIVRTKDLFEALRAYREETGASLHQAMAVIKPAIALEKLRQ